MTHKDVEEFIGLIGRLRDDRRNNVTGREWDKDLMEMAKEQKQHEMSAQEKRLHERRQQRLWSMGETERQLLQEQQARSKQNKLVIPTDDQVPENVGMDSGIVSKASLDHV